MATFEIKLLLRVFGAHLFFAEEKIDFSKKQKNRDFKPLTMGKRPYHLVYSVLLYFSAFRLQIGELV